MTFAKPPVSDLRLIAKYYRAWNIHQAVAQCRKEFPGEHFSVVEVIEKVHNDRNS